MTLIRYGDMTKHVLVFPSICLSPYGFLGMEYQKTYVGFIFLTIPRLGKIQSGIFELISVKVYTNVQWWSYNAWPWKQKLVGVSRTCRISWKIMKIIKTEKLCKIPKHNNYFTCLLSFRILVNLPNFEMLSHLNKLDLCGLF